MPNQLIQYCIAIGIASLLTACSGAGIYTNVSTAGPTVDLEPIHLPAEIDLGYQTSSSLSGF